MGGTQPGEPGSGSRRGPGWEGVVLTGGASSRMGRDKALLAVGGVPMAARVAAALAAAGASPVWCVGGDLAGLRAAGLVARADSAPGEGPLGGVITALGGARHDLVAVLACDLLAPDPPTMAALVGELVAHPLAQLALPVVDGRRQVLHGVWRRSALPVLRQAWDAGERSVRRAIRGFGVLDVPGVDPATQADADAPEDVAGLADLGGAAG